MQIRAHLPENGIDVFAKIIVTNKTEIGDISWISNSLSNIKFHDGKSVGLAIQPVYFEDPDLMKKHSISEQLLNNLFYAAGKRLKPESLSLSIQAHKYLNLL